MGRQFTISAMGLKLIKAYEGYRPVDRTLVSGQRVIGYGHRITEDEVKFLSKSEAENLLKTDLAPFEDMINENVHAPLTQSQFDALCSFAFNIGPKAFLTSDTLRALNNGRPLDAANGFDTWRKSEIDGKIYVVDALMRRRTAEKALFLRPEGHTLSASRIDLPPSEDETVALLQTDDGFPVFSKEDSANVVGTVPYDMVSSPRRRREDMAPGVLSLSEVYDENDDLEEDLTFTETSVEPQKTPSLIAIEEEKLKNRLDALIEDVKSDQKAMDVTAWEESLITDKSSKSDIVSDNVVDFQSGKEIDDPFGPESVEVAIDNLVEDLEAEGRSEDSASKYIELESDTDVQRTSTFPYWIMLTFGAFLLGASVALILKNAETLLGPNGSLWAMCGVFIGGMILLGSLYYAFRKTLSRLSGDN